MSSGVDPVELRPRRRRGRILLATRNEGETVPLVLEEIAEAVHGLERLGWHLDVVVVDDSSDDAVVETIQSNVSRLGIDMNVVRGPGAGLGAAILEGFRVCLRRDDVEFIVNLDADGQHDARQMGDLLRIFEATHAAITIGSRWAKGGRCYGLTIARRFVSRCSSIALRCAGVPRHVKDPTTSFRVYRRDVAELLVREVLGFNGFSFFGAGIAVANAHGRKVNETPIHFRPRVGGQSNLSLGQTWRAIRDLPRIRSHWSMIRRREEAFTRIVSNPEKYTASRELEQLSNTPISTRIIVGELIPDVGARVLEVGAGLGLITEQLLAAGKSVTALEPDPNLHERLVGRGLVGDVFVHRSTLDDFVAANPDVEKFDTALYVNVLEHIADDVAELTALRRILKPGGSVVIFVPAAPALYGSMDWISAHFRRYRKSELEAVARSSGFEIAQSRHFDAVGKFPYWIMYRVLKRETLGGGSVGLYDRLIIPMSAKVPRFMTERLGGKNLILVARPDSDALLTS